MGESVVAAVEAVEVDFRFLFAEPGERCSWYHKVASRIAVVPRSQHAKFVSIEEYDDLRTYLGRSCRWVFRRHACRRTCPCVSIHVSRLRGVCSVGRCTPFTHHLASL